MKVNRKYSTTLPSHAEFSELVRKIHETTVLVQTLVPRSLELSVEICSDVTFINEEDGRPVGAFQVGQGLPDEVVDAFAEELRTLVSTHRRRNGFI